MTTILEGLSAFTDIAFWGFMLLGMVLGLLVGFFPGVTMTMAVALASGFTLTLPAEQGLAVLLTIYVAGQFGDRIPAILINTPGTPASIATTLDGYPMAKNGQAGLALVVSGIGTAVGILASMVLFVLIAQPIASFALRFGPAEMFALVLFGLTVMISIASKSLLKGLLAGVLGLLLAVVGRDPITGDQRFTFGINELTSGVEFIAVIIGLFGIAEVLDQILTHRKSTVRPISSLGRWWPTKGELREAGRGGAIGGAIGLGVGIVPAAGGDIAGLIGWDRARSASKTPEKFGTGYVGGVAASDTASSATLGGSLTTTMALGIPGDSVMAVMIGSMIVWGIQPGPSLFTDRPDMVVLIAAIMVVATLITTAVSLVRTRGMVRLLDMKPEYLWAIILIFCMVGTYATSNNVFTVVTMMVSGVVGLGLKRAGIPAGPVVLGLLLGPLAEANLRRALVIGGSGELVSSWISIVLLALTALVLGGTFLRRFRTPKAAVAATSRDEVSPN
ncbi:tripartite tricarboxylate transporter permease [Georgenia sp. H159]|uniref:tripartite tricarboxylate transporter permease n=1 Tax=Georgenia sp. H159 TaxID=3076115 RepID=UPI002D789963|nr:tripartite tricarboxylate transporter permease [Georgenia sp. H159]